MTPDRRPRRPWDRTAVSEREYFELLGPGLVAVLPGRPPGGGAGGWQPPTGGAWVHVGHDGQVTGFTGKAEVGQGTRSALTLIVAEELRTPSSKVRLVMGDTDLCPWDMGTFGSRSMPDAAPALGRAAAGARQRLVALGAERLGRPAGEVEPSNGSVRPIAGGRGLSYGELVADRDRVEEVDPTLPLASAANWESAGHPFVDPGAVDVVTGRRAFASDLRRPGMLEGAILRPPTYGAQLAEIELGPDALGVTVLRDGGFVGVAAPSTHAARARIATMRARWTPAAQPGELEIEAYLRSHPAEGDSWDADEESSGDPGAALHRAAATVRATYRSAYLAHVPLETHCALAEWEAGRLTVWLGSQTPFRNREALAKALGVAIDDVRVIVPPTGSGFGGKHGGEIALAAARLARASGRPVRIAFSREEEFRYAYLRPMSVIDVEAGAGADGRLVAWSFRNFNGGAAALAPPYRVEDRKVDNVLSRSPLPQGSYRSLAAIANNFARESAIDELARATGTDPVEFRERNLDDERLRAVLRRAVERAGWSARRSAPGEGQGVAVGREKDGRVATIARVRADGEGALRVERLTTAFEAGAIVNPENLRSQVEGATVMALGGALFEAIRFDEGRIVNAQLASYRVPRFSDLPPIDVELIDRRDLPPAGAGESPMIAVAPALANAICDATGVRLRALPLLPDGRVPKPPGPTVAP